MVVACASPNSRSFSAQPNTTNQRKEGTFQLQTHRSATTKIGGDQSQRSDWESGVKDRRTQLWVLLGFHLMRNNDTA